MTDRHSPTALKIGRAVMKKEAVSNRVISPETRLSMVMMFVITYIFSPGVFWLYLTYLLDAGAFPVEADSIGIPMAGFLLLWFVGWVVMILAALALAIYRATFGTNLR